jgi:hypothetical protein
MQYSCWEGFHYVTMSASIVLFLAYAMVFPIVVAYHIARNKAAASRHEEHNHADNNSDVEPGAYRYWSSLKPLVEQWWFPLVSHLQPKYWWFFMVECFDKLWINLLYLRGFRSDDGCVAATKSCTRNLTILQRGRS